MLILIAFVIGIAAAVGGASKCGSGDEGVAAALKDIVPKRFVPIYQAASVKYRLGLKGPGMLASIHFNETSFGRNTNNTTGSGAEGQMMFMPETWGHLWCRRKWRWQEGSF